MASGLLEGETGIRQGEEDKALQAECNDTRSFSVYEFEAIVSEDIVTSMESVAWCQAGKNRAIIKEWCSKGLMERWLSFTCICTDIFSIFI